MSATPRVVLFDLDGTLVDSAPDLAGAGNEMRLQRGLPALPYETLRPMVGSGARGMVGVALQVTPGDPDFAALRDEFLARYEARLTRESRIFDAVVPVLSALDAASMRWGIVTNKVARYTHPVVQGLGLASRAAVVICGDSTPHSKPHPAPLLEAARRLGVQPGDCVYVGDDLRDVQAGRAAGMRTIAAAWGYLGLGEPIGAWNADAVIDSPGELLQWLAMP
ncbi:MAG: phosphoglycolate phosphatase [Burkholderiaceae bacterium]|nr:phosphoglycolate phosphatase [Burkholderiaceae bacterium]